jgi:hypothetical protein
MMKDIQKKLLIRTPFLLLAACLIFLLGACAPDSIDLRKEGFALLEKGFDSQEDSPLLNRTVELGNIRIHIVGDRSLLGSDQAKISISGLVGYATSGNDVYLLGKIVEGKIIVNQAVLGHEVMHLLNFKDPKIANPDKLDHLEMCAARPGQC